MAQLLKIKAQVSCIWAKRCILMTVYVSLLLLLLLLLKEVGNARLGESD